MGYVVLILTVLAIALFVIGYFLGKKKEEDKISETINEDVEKKVKEVIEKNKELMEKIKGLRIKNDE